MINKLIKMLGIVAFFVYCITFLSGYINSIPYVYGLVTLVSNGSYQNLVIHDNVTCPAGLTTRPKMEHCVVWGDVSAYGNMSMSNCIVFSSTGNANITAATGNITLLNCGIQDAGVTTRSGSAITTVGCQFSVANPFHDQGNDNYRLDWTNGSWAIGAATTGGPATDLEGYGRPRGGSHGTSDSDIGPYEWHLNVSINASTAGYIEGVSVGDLYSIEGLSSDQNPE